jgi:hypothetical protein
LKKIEVGMAIRSDPNYLAIDYGSSRQILQSRCYEAESIVQDTSTP